VVWGRERARLSSWRLRAGCEQPSGVARVMCSDRTQSGERGRRGLALCLSETNSIAGAGYGSLPFEVAVVHESGRVVVLSGGGVMDGGGGWREGDWRIR